MLPGRRARLVTSDGLVSEVPLDSLTPLERRRLLRETPQGLEPVALWLNDDGLPRDPHGWQHVFTEANKRLRALGMEGFAGAAHMLRHSCALRWFSVGRLLFDKKFAHLEGEELRDLRYEFGSTWDLVRLLLRHADQRTTKEIYLNPQDCIRRARNRRSRGQNSVRRGLHSPTTRRLSAEFGDHIPSDAGFALRKGGRKWVFSDVPTWLGRLIWSWSPGWSSCVRRTRWSRRCCGADGLSRPPAGSARTRSPPGNGSYAGFWSTPTNTRGSGRPVTWTSGHCG